jgi:hypothetical protein
MNMKSNNTILVFCGLSCALAACGVDVPTTASTTTVTSRLSDARAFAEQELATDQSDAHPTWPKDARITAQFPVFLPGRAEPSYYEFKVEVGDQPRGYIVASADRADIPVPELAGEGITPTERYRAAINRQDLHIVRYDWLRSAAFASDRVTPLASVGFAARPGITVHRGTGTDLVQALQGFDADYEKTLALRGVVPQETAERIARAYRDQSGDLGLVAPHHDALSYYSELSYDFRNGWHLPAWYQPENAAGEPVGCGSTAWAMVYGFWHEFKGKSALFDELDLRSELYQPDGSENPVVYDGMFEIADLTDTDFDVSGSSVSTSDMVDATEFAHRRGYTEATALEWTGGEYSKHEAVRGEIDADRPVILTINADGIGAINHYVGVEAVRRREVVGLDDIRYLLNYGWGDTRVWISAHGGEPHHTVTSAYFVRMDSEHNPTALTMGIEEEQRGLGTVCAPYESNTLLVRLEGYNGRCSAASLVLSKGGVALATYSAAQNRLVRVDITGQSGSLQLDATCGTATVRRSIAIDTRVPAITRLSNLSQPAGTTWSKNPVQLSATPSDDGAWRSSDYALRFRIDGGAWQDDPGTTAALPSLTTGYHTVDVRLLDGCGRLSTTQSLTVRVDGTIPVVSFTSPTAGASFTFGSTVGVTLSARDPSSASGTAPSGIGSVKLFLDDYPGEFSAGVELCSFTGPFASGTNTMSCTVPASWTLGRHTLIAQVTDVAGNRSEARRDVDVTLRLIVPLP